VYTKSVGQITRKIWKCDRCKHEWLSRDGETPLRCAKCKSPYWNIPKHSSLEQAREAMKRKKAKGGD